MNCAHSFFHHKAPNILFLKDDTVRLETVKNLVALALAEDIGVLVERAADELGLLPQVGGEETVGVGNGDEGGLEGVLKGLGGTGRGRVGVADTSKLQQTLDSGGGNETGTAGGGNKLERAKSDACACRLRMWNRLLTLTVTEPHLPLSLTGME